MSNNLHQIAMDGLGEGSTTAQAQFDSLQLFQEINTLTPQNIDEFLVEYGFPAVMPVAHINSVDDPAGKKSEASVSVSSSFFPGAHKDFADATFRSLDSTLFYVNSELILKASRNSLSPVLGGLPLDHANFQEGIVDIPDRSSVLDIILHTIYDLSAVKHSPSLDDLVAAVDRLPAYGLLPAEYVQPGMPLFDLLLAQACTKPMEVYALAGQYKLHDLAVRVSPHLLSYCLPDMSDAIALRVGPVYLNRLMQLHMALANELKRITLAPPTPHQVRPSCTFEMQGRLNRAWVLTASYLTWDSRPDMSIHQIQTTFLALEDRLECEACIDTLRSRVKDVSVQWLNTKVESQLLYAKVSSTNVLDNVRQRTI